MTIRLKKTCGIFLAVILLLNLLPQKIHAEEPGYGYEVIVEPAVAAIGSEVTLTVRLTDYDKTKSGIRGFQIDIYNRENMLQKSKCEVLFVDQENTLSNTAKYQPNRNLVRHLYAKMSGTLDYSVSDLLRVTIPIDATLAQAGTVSLPFRLLVQSAGGGQYTYNSDVEISYAPAGEITSVDVEWGAMDFTYQDGGWQPDSHSFAEGKWSANNGSNTFTIKNNGSTAVTSRITYVTERADIKGIFLDEKNAKNEILISEIGAKSSQTYELLLEGKPKEAMEKVKIGNVTIVLE